MDSEHAVKYQKQGAVAILTLNRPERLNALNEAVREGFMAGLRQAKDDDEVGAVVVTGAGRAFSAGGDLEVFADIYRDGSRKRVEEFTDLEFPRFIAEFPKPMIAAINGAAVGWGFTLPLLCDIRLASSKAIFSCGFVRIGVTPEFGSSALLPKLIGLSRAMELVLTARQVEPEEALSIGLISQVCEPDELMPRAMGLASTIAAYPRPAIMMAKSLMRHGAQSSLDQSWEYEIGCFQKAMGTPEHYEAVQEMLRLIKDKKQ